MKIEIDLNEQTYKKIDCLAKLLNEPKNSLIKEIIEDFLKKID